VWNKGYATEAAIACLEYGLNNLHLDEIIAVCHPENIGSWRVMEKAGMAYLGTASYYGLAGLKKYAAQRDQWCRPALQ
jgi:RimJ/RimL family protein N-acetyltransferase